MARGAPRTHGSTLDALELGPRLAAERLEPFYVVVGEESFLRDEALRVLREAQVAGGPVDCVELDGQRAELAAALDEARTLPFLGGAHRLVVVRQVGPAGPKLGFLGEHVDALLEFVASPPGTATLVLEAERVDRRRKGVKALLDAARVVSCGPCEAGRLVRFVRDRARRWGRPFAPGAAEALVERLGGQNVPLATLDAEVRKLASGGEGPIDAATVAALATVGSSEESFGLVDCVGRGDVASALERLHVIFRDGLIVHGDRQRDPTSIGLLLLGMLRWDLGRLLRARALLDVGRPGREVTRELKVFRDQDRFLARVRAADRAALGRRHALLRQADAALKSSGDALGTLAAVTVQLCRGEGGSAARAPAPAAARG